jgi:hypothetical protein
LISLSRKKLIVNPIMMQAMKNWMLPMNNSVGALFTPFMSIYPFLSISLALKKATMYENICSSIRQAIKKFEEL